MLRILSVANPLVHLLNRLTPIEGCVYKIDKGMSFSRRALGRCEKRSNEEFLLLLKISTISTKRDSHLHWRAAQVSLKDT